MRQKYAIMKVGFLGTVSVRKTFRFIILGLALLANLCCIASYSEAGKALTNNVFHVGYRILDLKYQASEKERIVTIAVWYPTVTPPKRFIYGGPTRGSIALDAEPHIEGGPYPLLVFSHGYGGSGLGSVFFTEPLAALGWIVVAPDHHDRHTAVRIRSGGMADYDSLGLLRHAQEITRSGPNDREAYLYRLDEMKLVLDRILESEPFGKLIDRNKITVGGHSFGGFTALGLCGTIEERRDDRIKAVLLFSTGAGGYLFRESELAAVKVPSMYFLGEREKDQKRGSQTMAELADKIYRNLPPPKYLLEIRGANHFSFNNCFNNRAAHLSLCGAEEQFGVIRRYSIAFLEKHGAGKKDVSSVLEQQDPLLTRYIREPSIAFRD